VETHDDLHLIRELGCSHIQGYIFGKPAAAEDARVLANKARIEAEGFQCVREPRHRLMRRAIASLEGFAVEVKLRNISAMGALVECTEPVTPGQRMTMDIVGVGPVMGTVKWAHAGKFGLHFEENFDLSRLSPKREKGNDVLMMTP